MTRQSFVEIDRVALTQNYRALVAHVAPANVCGVVKANGYGHGAFTAARAALDGGASMVAVALVDEAVELREAGIDAPILVLSEPADGDLREAIAHELEMVVATPEKIEAIADLTAGTARLHLKIDTGMHRVGCAPADASALVAQIESQPALELVGIATHCPVADEPDDVFTIAQVERFAAIVETLRPGLSKEPVIHAANSAAALALPAARFDMVRLGIATYGAPPAPHLSDLVEISPALSLRSVVSALRSVDTGDGVSYGHRWRAETDTTIATVPMGYADGIRRSSGQCGVEVLHRGRRCPIVGQVTMDQFMIDLGPDVNVQDAAVGDEVIVIGRQGNEQVSAIEIADRLGTISYEVFCDLSERLPRVLRN
jgi:alanine racemase